VHLGGGREQGSSLDSSMRSGEARTAACGFDAACVHCVVMLYV
jgi:hypothetical protein